MRHAADDVTDGYARAELAEMLAALVRLNRPDQQTQTAVMTGTHAIAAAVTRSEVGNGTTDLHHGAHQMAHQILAADCVSQRLSATNITIAGSMSVDAASIGNLSERRVLAAESGAVRLSALNSELGSDNLARVRPGTQVD